MSNEMPEATPAVSSPNLRERINKGTTEAIGRILAYTLLILAKILPPSKASKNVARSTRDNVE